MDPEFWHQRWKNNQIGFHEPQANPSLVDNINALALVKNQRIFLPLCGKTLDIGWLLSQGYRVAGAELSALAIEQLFDELGVEPRVTKVGQLQHYQAEGLDIFGGDLFALTKETLGAVDAVYDRAALVALPEPMRVRYAQHLMAITAKAPQLLITFVYDQTVMPGPPFAVSDAEVTSHYAADYTLQQLQSKEVAGGLKGKCPAEEHVWLLQCK
ncbi:thiopurine S-methyltransferase [Microbulbifer sp. SAOS-129_SWC]|uniref:thiopurine S-methyltransferase n=1 Tax=Microbulbifer sp. SAOS-129_SWC TaxID=3145235 RepID=UPI0032169021